jgi:hypothetical protein
MRRTHLLHVFAVLVLLGAAACGDDDGGGGGATGDGDEPTEAALTSDEQAFADAWAGTLSDDAEDDDFSFEADEAQCMGEAIMAEVGTEPFDEADIAPGDIDASEEDESPGELLGAGGITDEQADAILDRWDDCADLNAAFVDLVAGQSDLDADARSCIADGLEEGNLVHEGFKASLTSDDSEPPDEVVTELISLMGTCGGDAEGEGGLIVDGIAQQLASSGALDAEQSQCVAQAMVDAIGVDRLIELGVSGGEFEEADTAVQQEMAEAVVDAAEACNVPISALGG